MKPLVLLSNDDGFEAPYLHALADAIDAAGIAETLVVAPERPRSAASHAITLHKPLRLRDRGPNRHVLSGTPVDCVYVGVVKLAKRRPSLVLSGINVGFNLGMDVFYSGTVAAAVEGALRGIPAVALSLDAAKGRDVDAALRFSVAVSERVLAHGLPPRAVLNVNFPARSGTRYAWTHLGNRHYEDDVGERLDPRNRPYYWIGGRVAKIAHEPASDCGAVERGDISITPLYLDLTSHEMLGGGLPWELDGYQHASPTGG